MVRFGNSKVLSENGVEEVPLAGSPPAKPGKSVKVAPAQPDSDGAPASRPGAVKIPASMMPGRSVMTGAKPGGSTGMTTNFASMHWRDPRAFRSEEGRRREINRVASNAGNLNNKLFLSHCWRKTSRQEGDEDLQAKKRQMIAHLSTPSKDGGPGLVYWSDFLDLQAEGPVPWRREIEDAVRSCSKVVCFVDEGWLTSFNCLQELAFSILEGKPIVLLVLDQEAWELLTVPSGTKKAWSQDKWGPALSQYEDHEITPGERFTREKLDSLFSYISGINLCACRELEEANFGGMPGLMDNMQKYVMKDLIYFKQHAELKDMARRWEAGDKRSSLLLHRAEAMKWDLWVEAAEQVGASPPPTKIQKEFVMQSMSQARKTKTRLQAAAGLLLALILLGAVASGVMASLAVQQQREAQEQTRIANEQRAEADLARIQADEQKDLADIARQTAVEKEKEALRDKEQAQLANRASTSALIVSVLGNMIGTPVVRANELRLYIKAAELLLNGNRPHMELQLINKLQTRMSRRLWAAQQPRYGHYDNVISAAWSPVDRRLLASGSHDSRVIVRNMDTGQEWVLSGHSSSVQVLEWSPVNANMLASGSHDGSIRIWDLSKPQNNYVVMELTGHSGTVTALSWSRANPGKLASGAEDNAVYIWNLGNGLFRELIGHQGTVRSLAWYPLDESQLASGSEDRTVRLWNLLTNDVPTIVAGFNGTVNSLAYSVVDGGRKLAAGSADRVVRVWNPAAPSAGMTVLSGAHLAGVTSVMWDPLRSASRLASIDAAGVVAGWDLTSSAPLKDVLHALRTGGPQLLDAAYLLGGLGWSSMNSTRLEQVRVVQTRGSGEEVRVWNLIPGVTKQLAPQTTAPGARRLTAVAWAAGSCEGNQLAVGATGDNTVQVWDFLTGVGRVLRGHGGEITNVAWSPFNCARLASTSLDGSARVWNVGTGEFDALYGGASGGTDTTMTALAWSPDAADTLATASWDGSVGLVELWDMSVERPAGQRPPALAVLTNRPSSLAWSTLPGGPLAVSAGTTVHVYDVAGNTRLPDLPERHTLEVLSLQWSPTKPGVLVSGGYDSRVVLWDLDTGAATTLLGHQGTVAAVAWSPDGRKVATGSPIEAAVRVWDYESPDLVQVLPINAGQTGVSALSWSEEDSLLVSVSPDDATARAWWHTRRDSQDWDAALRDIHSGDPSLRLSDLTDFDLPRDMLADLDTFELS